MNKIADENTLAFAKAISRQAIEPSRKPVCEDCGDSGYVETSPRRLVFCDCKIGRRVKKQADQSDYGEDA